MAQIPTLRDAIIELLRENPEGLTQLEIAEEMGRAIGAIQSTVRNERMRRGSENFRIAGYRRAEMQTGQSAPVFVLGPGPDAKRPPVPKDAVKKAKERYRERNRLLLRLKDRAASGTANPFAQLLALR